MPGNKVLVNNAGQITEVATNNSSAGAADANKIVSLNAQGLLDSTMVNSKTTSVGAGDSGKIPALDGSGRLDQSFMPVGIGADTQSIVASEALAAGNLVNIWNDGGVAKVRKADATVAGKEAQGFVLDAVSSGASATVYFEGNNTAVTGRTPGLQYLATTAGTTATAAPTGAGNVVQRVGFATSATSVNFQAGTPIVLA
jgi:hypothetical protein